jgi:glycosyltransferase involved in cell wall biosynthesis
MRISAKKSKVDKKLVDPHLLSVIVPAYNCKTIRKDLIFIKKNLDRLNRPYELICIVDGLKSKKDPTSLEAKRMRKKEVKVYTYRENKGKGYAVRFGMARSRGGIIVFIDAGSDLHAKGIALALEHLKWYNADIIIGSKRHHASKVYYPARRKILSFFVQKATRFFFGLNVSDTQTGLKVFRRKVLVKVLPRLLVKRWAFDLEILAVANHLGFKRIYESPVEITHKFDSNVTIKAVQNFVTDYLAILYRLYLLRYYDDGYVDKWEGDPNLGFRYKNR